MEINFYIFYFRIYDFSAVFKRKMELLLTIYEKILD